MKTIETTANVTEDGRLTVRVPATIPPGSHRVVVVIEELPEGERQAAEEELAPLADFPVIHVGEWPPDLSLRREDMYDDWGR